MCSICYSCVYYDGVELCGCMFVVCEFNDDGFIPMSRTVRDTTARQMTEMREVYYEDNFDPNKNGMKNLCCAHFISVL